MSTGIECLITDSQSNARKLARTLDDINRQRKEIEGTMQSEAFALAKQAMPKRKVTGLCLFDSSWHQGIVGLVASRLKERLNCPVMVFAKGDNDELKGSARSVTGLHIRDLLCDLDSRHPGILLKFGGHAMAAGASIHSNSFAEFKSAFESLSEERQEQLAEADILYTDGSVDAELDDLRLIHDIKFAAPWGQGFPEPLFDDVFTVVDQRLVGDIHLKLRLRKEGAGHQTIDGICFRFLTSPTRR